MKKKSDYITILITALTFISVLILTISTACGNEFNIVLPEVCGLGMRLTADGFRCVMAVAASFLWLMTAVFSPDYMAHEENKTRYYVFNLISLFSKITGFFAADLFTLFIAFEIMSIASYVFVVQEETKEAIRAAGTYMAVAVIGGLVLLMGLLLMYFETGTLMINELASAVTKADNYNVIIAAAICMLFGFAAKAGMFPLHIWLPKAHPVAPAPASALLSGMLTKSGIFGIIIVSIYIMKDSEKWGYALLTFACITMVLGAVLAIFSNQMKRTLACSSVSQIGFILVGVAMQVLLGEEGLLAVNGTILHMLNHSTFKLVLFLLAGAIYMGTHNLDYNAIRGYCRGKIFFMIIYLAGALGIGGIPLLSGYVSKTLLHESITEYIELINGTEIAGYMKAAEWAFLIAGGLTVAYMLKLFVILFVEKPVATDSTKQVKMSLRTKITLLLPATLIVIFGVFPNAVFGKLAYYTGSCYGSSEELSVNYFSFTNLKGSLISIAIGIAVYLLIIRPFMIKKVSVDNAITHEYIDRWPKWMDLEDSVYRPLLLRFIPFALSVICRIFDKFIDGFIGIIQKKALSPIPKRTPVPVGTRFSYAVGIFLDDVAALLNHTILKKHPIKKSFVKMVEIGRTEADRTGKLITRSISFALLFFCLGLLFTLIYLLSIT